MKQLLGELWSILVIIGQFTRMTSFGLQIQVPFCLWEVISIAIELSYHFTVADSHTYHDLLSHNTQKGEDIMDKYMALMQQRQVRIRMSWHRPLTRYPKLRVAHAPGISGTFSPPPRVSDSDMHHGTCVTHVPWCKPGSLTSDFLWSRWQGKRSRRMRNPQFYASDKRPMETLSALLVLARELRKSYCRALTFLWCFLCR